MATIVPTPSPAPPGLAHHSSAIAGTISATTAASHGLRGPIRSIAAPSSGAVSITTQPAYFAPAATSACPRTPSPTTLVTKYGAKT